MPCAFSRHSDNAFCIIVTHVLLALSLASRRNTLSYQPYYPNHLPRGAYELSILLWGSIDFGLTFLKRLACCTAL